MTTAIAADGLRKTYRGVPALDDFHLGVPAGTVCGLLGPNGAAAVVGRVTGTAADADPDTRRLRVAVADPVAALTAVVGALAAEGFAVDDIGIRRPTLDEAFLHLTGREGTP